METYFEKYVQAGGIMMFLIIPCSLLAVAYIIQGFVILRRGKIVPKELLFLVRSVSDQKSFNEAYDTIVNEKSVAGKVLLHVLQNEGKNTELEIEYIVSDVVSRLYNSTSALSTLYIVSPMLGLLGTIIGIMDAFENFSLVGGGSIADLSIGINQALITTAWGLFIAVPCFVFASILQHKIFNYEKKILPEFAGESLAKIGEYSVSENG